jgi:hypothetical protein
MAAGLAWVSSPLLHWSSIASAPTYGGRVQLANLAQANRTAGVQVQPVYLGFGVCLRTRTVGISFSSCPP